MRNNQPVTQREHQIPEGTHLVSVTDPQGRILYVNSAFIEASGFSENELLGQPHNLVRHPDMPQEAFRDLWATLKEGLPWTGLVKNRRKNGDHYWVLANATPVNEQGQVTGYLSVRIVPGREAIKQAEGLYARMLAEEQAGRISLHLHHGQVLKQNFIARTVRLLTPGLRGRLGTANLLAASFVAATAYLPVPYGVRGVIWLAVAAATSMIVWRMMINPLHALLAQTRKLASGDLIDDHVSLINYAPGSPFYGMQQGLNQAKANIVSLIEEFNFNAEHMRGAIAGLVDNSMNLSARTESQASSLEETASAMEEINSTVQHSAEATRQTSVLANETSDTARSGDVSVQAVATTMDSISESSNKIGAIIQVIDGVAFQTNILALNAAVEAARAGEAGRGFAVVASEVRALAQRTTAAAHDIKQLIEASEERVIDGNQRTQEARARMQKVLEAVEKVNNLLGEVTTASTEQRLGISQITEAVNQLDGFTQQNSNMVEQLAANTQLMQLQIEGMVQTARLFRTNLHTPSVTSLNARELKVRAQTQLIEDESFDLNKAIATHEQWKVKLRNAAVNHEKLDAATLHRDDACALGQWLYGDGDHQHGTRSTFTTLKTTHKDFHRSAGKIADTINAGQTDKAQRMLSAGTDFSDATEHVLSAIHALKREIS
jgi:aerotaxis receptor